MDVVCGEYGDALPGLVEASQNGRLVYQEDSSSPSPTQALQGIRCPGYFLK